MKNDFQEKESIFLDELNNLPDDQYCCPDCEYSPEIVRLNFNDDTISIKCTQKKKRQEKVYSIIQYFLDESKYHYAQSKCDICYENRNILKKQYNYLNEIFKYCSKCNKNLCKECSDYHHKIHSKNFLSYVNEKNTKSDKCPIYYNRYCLKCNMHLSENDSHDVGHNDNIKNLTKQKNGIDNYIKKLKVKKLNLLCFIKLIDSLIKTYESHSTNYFHILNIINASNNVNSMASFNKLNLNDFHVLQKDIKKDFKNNNINNSPIKKTNNNNSPIKDRRIYDINKDKHLNNNFIRVDENYSAKDINNSLKINNIDLEEKFKEITINLENLKKKIDLSFVDRLDISLVSNEDNINLSNRNINEEQLLSLLNIIYPELKTLDLSHNMIINLELISKIKAPKLKNLDLSFNCINDIKPLEAISKSFPEIETLSLIDNNIKIEEIKPLKKNIKTLFPNIKKFNIHKDIDKEIDFIIKKINSLYNNTHNLNKIENKIVINNATKDRKNNSIIYLNKKINDDETIQIFGTKFVKKNKNNCFIYINGEKKEICDYYKFVTKEEYIYIQLEMNDKVIDMSDMFKDCNCLFSLP